MRDPEPRTSDGCYGRGNHIHQSHGKQMVGREVNFETEKEPAKPGKTILDIQHLNVYNKQDFRW